MWYGMKKKIINRIMKMIDSTYDNRTQLECVFCGFRCRSFRVMDKHIIRYHKKESGWFRNPFIEGGSV